MTAWQTGLSCKDSTLMFAQLMGFTEHRDGRDYLNLESVLDYYGVTSCSHPISSTEEYAAIVGYKICGVFQLIFSAKYEQGQGIYPPAKQLRLSIVDERGLNTKTVTGLSRQVDYTPLGRKYCVEKLGYITLCDNQVVAIITVLSKLRAEYDDWNYYMETT